MTTTAFVTWDLHPIDNAHAGRHNKEGEAGASPLLLALTRFAGDERRLEQLRGGSRELMRYQIYDHPYASLSHFLNGQMDGG